MAETFEAPQPFNVEIGPEPEVTPCVIRVVANRAVPETAQEMSLDRNLYGPTGRGVRAQGVVRRPRNG